MDALDETLKAVNVASASSSPLDDFSDACRMNSLFHTSAGLSFGRRNHGTDGAGLVEPETYSTRLTESAQNCTHGLKSFPLDDNQPQLRMDNI